MYLNPMKKFKPFEEWTNDMIINGKHVGSDI